MERVDFRPDVLFQVEDSSALDPSTLFDSSCVFKQEEERHYLFKLKPISDSQVLESKKEYSLGILNLRWRNLYGDVGSLRLGPYKSEVVAVQNQSVAAKILDFQLISPLKLSMEQSQVCRFKVFNLSEAAMDLRIYKAEQDENTECLITEI